MRKVSELNWPLNTQTQSPARHNYFRFSIKIKAPEPDTANIDKLNGYTQFITNVTFVCLPQICCYEGGSGEGSDLAHI